MSDTSELHHMDRNVAVPALTTSATVAIPGSSPARKMPPEMRRPQAGDGAWARSTMHSHLRNARAALLGPPGVADAGPGTAAHADPLEVPT